LEVAIQNKAAGAWPINSKHFGIKCEKTSKIKVNKI